MQMANKYKGMNDQRKIEENLPISNQNSQINKQIYELKLQNEDSTYYKTKNSIFLDMVSTFANGNTQPMWKNVVTLV